MMGCEAGAPAAPANWKRRKREARLKRGGNGMVDRVVRTLATMDLYIEKQEGEYTKCGQCIDIKGKLQEVKWEDVWDAERNRIRSTLEIWKRTGVDIKNKEKNLIKKGKDLNDNLQWKGEGGTKRKRIRWQFNDWPWPTEGEVTEVHGNIWVWTDGSVSNGDAGAGVFYRERSVLNEAARVGGAQTISNAELEAVEMAVKRAPIKRGKALVIFTDSQYVLGQIEKGRKGEKIWTHKWRTNEIMEAIRVREGKGMKVVMQKVYSHFEPKMEKAVKEGDKDMIDRMEANLKDIKQKWGHEQKVLDGNKGADRLANRGRTMKKHSSWVGGTMMQIVDHEGVNIGGRSKVMERMEEKWQKGWRKQADEKYGKGNIKEVMELINQDEEEFEMRVRNGLSHMVSPLLSHFFVSIFLHSKLHFFLSTPPNNILLYIS